MFLPTNITLQFGDSGDSVAELQRRLAARQCLARNMITSFYDGPTVSAVRTFQIASGINGDGIAGPETLRRLNSFFTEGDGEAAGTNGSSEQESSIQPSADQYITKQMTLEAERQQVQQQQVEQQIAVDTHAMAATQQRAEIDMQRDQQLARDQERDLAKQLERTQQQQQGREQQQQQQTSQRAELDSRAASFFQPDRDQQAFIDKPMHKSIDDLAPKPEQEIGGKERGPSLGLDPSEGKDKQLSPDKEKSTAAGISVPKLDGPDAAKTIEPARAAAPAAGVAAGATTNIAMSPDMARIKGQMESQLPPHVIEEVKEVGVVMLNQGVKQTQMPGVIGSPERTPGMDERQAAVGASAGGRGI